MYMRGASCVFKSVPPEHNIEGNFIQHKYKREKDVGPNNMCVWITFRHTKQSVNTNSHLLVRFLTSLMPEKQSNDYLWWRRLESQVCKFDNIVTTEMNSNSVDMCMSVYELNAEGNSNLPLTETFIWKLTASPELHRYKPESFTWMLLNIRYEVPFRRLDMMRLVLMWLLLAMVVLLKKVPSSFDQKIYFLAFWQNCTGHGIWRLLWRDAL